MSCYYINVNCFAHLIIAFHTPSIMASTSTMTCPLCANVAHLSLDFKGLIKHLQLFHAHQPDFKVPCGIVGCSRRFTNLITYQNHMSSEHNFCTNIESRVLEQDTSEVVECFGDRNEDNNDSDDDNDMSTSTVEMISDSTTETAPNPKDLLKSSALFLLGLKEKYKLTQASVQGIINGVTSLIQQNTSFLQSQASWYTVILHIYKIFKGLFIIN